MTKVIAGVDVGGTKTTIVFETPDGRRVVEHELPSLGWDAEPLEQGVAWIADRLEGTVPDGHRIVAVGIGAQGLDTPEISASFGAALAERGYLARAVNDAALVVPAAGLPAGIGVISGTGAIAIGRDAAGAQLAAGGWGWVIGDEAGAAGIVREATKLALLAHDDGEADDGLLGALLAAFGVADAERLARAVNDEPTMDNWGPRAPAVFAAADAGSTLARTVVVGAAAHLALLVDQLVRRGVTGEHVVAAGSVIVNQPRLFRGFADAVAARHPSLSVLLLTEPPVAGALAIARDLLPASPP